MKTNNIFYMMILILLFSIKSYSQYVNFTAVNSYHGFKVNLDSVRIVDERNGSSIVLKKDFSIDLMGLSVVENPPNTNIIKELGNNIMFDYEHINILYNQQTDSKVNISLFNILGRLENSVSLFLETGVYSLNITANNLESGLNLISIRNENEVINKKILILNNQTNNLSNPQMNIIPEKVGDYSFVANSKTGKISSIDSYTFISYAANYFNDTLKNIIPSHNQEIQFRMIPYSFWTVRKCHININIPVYMEKREQYVWIDPDTIINHDNFVKDYIDIDSNFENKNMWCVAGDCYNGIFSDTLNSGDSLNLCFCAFSGYGDYYSFSANIDTIKNILINIKFSHFAEKTPMNNQPQLVCQIFGIIIDTLPISSISYNNIRVDLMKDITPHCKSLYYNAHYFQYINSHSWYEQRFESKSTLADENNTHISITLSE